MLLGLRNIPACALGEGIGCVGRRRPVLRQESQGAAYQTRAGRRRRRRLHPRGMLDHRRQHPQENHAAM